MMPKCHFWLVTVVIREVFEWILLVPSLTVVVAIEGLIMV